MDTNLENLIRENIRALVPYSSARSIYQNENAILLDANENPFGRYNRYPDPLQMKLKNKLATIKKTKPEQVFLDNGSDNIIDLAFRVFCNPGTDKALAFSPTFGMFKTLAQINAIDWIEIPLKNNFQLDLKKVKPHFSDEKLKLIFLCSPNNPTGNSLNEKDLLFILDNFSGILILDEAYIDFCPEKTRIGLLAKYPRLIILQTLSKAWGMAGIRLGMAFMNAELVTYFNKVKMPYNISTVNQEKALEVLGKQQEYENSLHLILSEKNKILYALQELKIVVEIYPSDTNFLLVKFTDAQDIYQNLLYQNLIVRNWENQVKNCLRITIGTPEENKKLINALKIIDND